MRAQGPVDLGHGAAGRGEVDDELLEEAVRERDAHALDLAQPLGGVGAALQDRGADLAKPSGPSSAM